MKVLMWLSIGLDRRTPSEHLLKAIVESLYKQGHTVHILQKNTGGEDTSFKDLIEKYCIQVTNISIKKTKKNSFIYRYLLDLIYVFKCKKVLKNEHYDRVFLQSSNVAGYEMYYLKKFANNVPVLFNVQDIFPENASYVGKLKKKNVLFKFFEYFQHKAYKQASKIITISEDMKNEIVGAGIPESKVHVVYNWGYQDEVYNPVIEKNDVVDSLISNKFFNVVYAGNIGMMQNVDVILESASLLIDNKKIKFHIFGNGLYRSRLEDKARKLNLGNVSFHDMLDKKYAPSIYCKADVNVIPLAKDIYKTALPSKTAICLASQKPIVLAIGKKSIFAQKLSKSTGAPIIDSLDYQKLASIITDFYNNNIEYNSENFYTQNFKLSENSRKYVKVLCD